MSLSKRNDIRRVPGSYIVAAMDRLPPCGPASTIRSMNIETALWGIYKVTYRPVRQAHRGCPDQWFWIAREAELIDAPG